MKLIAAASACALMAAVAAAQAQDVTPKIDDPISLRQNLMKDAGASIGMLAAIAKGEAEFNAAAVKGALVALNAVALGFPAQFPEGSTSETSEASPKIWEDAAGFQSAAAKFIADTNQAKGMTITNADEMKQAMGLVGANCKACHESYRVKKN
ncbi:cytochrome c [Albimonas sp. CAU 1670]|uniref:c-type cytochrome n=1 Tax=Albimonas sp. CAU 1670 TaxID=3032599 RepID=UPI0023DADF8E|nr:cytochrome c [Albimonas sp. CAU 1670]MDF2232871.1 cytochrome c [Albimonas sp. CAU 1670]